MASRASSIGVGAMPKVDSKAEESTTKGRSNWYRVSRSSRTSGDTTPMALKTQRGIRAMRGAGAPASALSRSAKAWADSNDGDVVTLRRKQFGEVPTDLSGADDDVLAHGSLLLGSLLCMWACRWGVGLPLESYYLYRWLASGRRHDDDVGRGDDHGART